MIRKREFWPKKKSEVNVTGSTGLLNGSHHIIGAIKIEQISLSR